MVAYKDVFNRYLRPGGTCFEIGFLPGHILTYLSKQFHFTVSGIDLTPFVESQVRDRMSHNGATVGKLAQGDFLRLDSSEKYDVVCSFGFVEHFSDTEDIIKRHIDLVREGGTLIISCPNFRGAQYAVHHKLDRENLENHNLAAMDLDLWKRILERNGMTILFQGYHRTFGLWLPANLPGSLLTRGLAYVVSRTAFVADLFVRYPNPHTSPSMISLSRKAMSQSNNGH